MWANANHKYAIVSWLKEQIPGHSTFRDILLSVLADPSESIKDGRILIGFADVGTSSTYNGLVGASQAQILELFGYLLRLYDQIALSLTDPSAAPNDDDVVTAMLTYIDQTPRGYTTNWMWLTK